VWPLFFVKYSGEHPNNLVTAFTVKRRANRGTTKDVLGIETGFSSFVEEADLNLCSCFLASLKNQHVCSLPMSAYIKLTFEIVFLEICDTYTAGLRA
jgi:hypothetical protein